MAYKKDEEKFKGLAEERTEILFGLAKTDTEEVAKGYVKSAIRIAKFCNLRLGNKKALFCRQCQTFFNSENSKVRLNSKKKRTEILCLRCGYKRFYGYEREQKEKRKKKNILESGEQLRNKFK